MKTAGIVHLSSFGFILTIFTGYKGNSGELVSERAKKKLHPHSVIDLRSKRKTQTLKPLLRIVPESDGHSPTSKPAMVHIYLWVLQSLWVLQNL
jgi:hypothetical protein